MNSAETLDMVICLEEICRMFLVPADQVAKVWTVIFSLDMLGYFIVS